mgnify:CR=1 FL=1
MMMPRWLVVFGLVAVLAVLSACSTAPRVPEQAGSGEPVPRYEPPSKTGNPASYVVHGKRYFVRQSNSGYQERGMASWYGPGFHGKRTSSGETYDMHAMTAAHKTLVIPTYAEVTNLRNGRTIVVRVNDRGPFHDGRIIDLSREAAKRLDMLGEGTAPVEVRALMPGDRPASRPVRAEREPRWGENVFVQVGAFSNRDNALRLKSRLLGQEVPGVEVQAIQRDGRPLFRVRVGPVASSDHAEQLLDTLQARGLFGQHVVIDGCQAEDC